MFDERRPKTSIFGRTDLRKGVIEAKFDVEVAGDVNNSLAPPKSAENHEKPEFCWKKNWEKFFRRRKIESCKSSETRFPEVSCRSEPSSRGERTFEVRIFMVEYVFFSSKTSNGRKIARIAPIIWTKIGRNRSQR